MSTIIDLTGCCSHIDGDQVTIYKVIPSFVKNVDIELLKVGRLLRIILIREPAWIEAYDNRGVITTVQILNEDDKSDIAELVSRGDHVIHIHVVNVSPVLSGDDHKLSVGIGRIHVSCFDQLLDDQKKANIPQINSRLDKEIEGMKHISVSVGDMAAIQDAVAVARVKTLADRAKFSLSVARSNKRPASDQLVFKGPSSCSITPSPSPATKRFKAEPTTGFFNSDATVISSPLQIPRTQNINLFGPSVKIARPGNGEFTNDFVRSEFEHVVSSTPADNGRPIHQAQDHLASKNTPATPIRSKFIDPTDIYAEICANSPPIPSSASRESVFTTNDFLESVENARRSIYHTLSHLVHTVTDGEIAKNNKVNHSEGSEFHAVLDFVKGRAKAAVLFSEAHPENDEEDNDKEDGKEEDEQLESVYPFGGDAVEESEEEFPDY